MARIRFSLVVTALACGLVAPSVARAESSSNGIAAVVNGKVIVKSEYNEAVLAQKQMIAFEYRDDAAGMQKALAEVDAKALDDLIDRELILAEFTKTGGVIKPQYVEDDINTLVRERYKGDRDKFVVELALSGMTMKKFRELREKMIIVSFMRSRHAGKQVPPTPKEVEDYYKTNADKFRDGDMIKLSTISVEKFPPGAGATVEGQKKLLEEIRSKIVAGAEFSAMAKTYSVDSHSSEGGDWGWTARKDLKPLMAEAAFAVKNGGVSPVLTDDTRFLIIYVDTKKLGTMKPLDEVRPGIERAINSESAKADLQQWLQTLRKSAVIRKF